MSSDETHTSSKSLSEEELHQDGEEAGVPQADEKNDVETEPDITSWSFPTPEAIREELSKEFTDEQKEKVWTECTEAVKTSYDQLLGRWKEEMDTLLVYAGVSSAVLTAFNVESYHLLQPDPADPTLAVLKQISAQLNGYTFAPPFLNATHTARPSDLTQAPFQAPASAVWLNSLWFSSLVFSFAAALLALFVKQWLYEGMVPGTSPESARLRQYRFNGLLKWRVGTVVVVLPILLQLASILFLAGLLVLLWTLHNIVAAIASVLVGLVFAFVIGFTLLPVFKSDCSYRSPASFAIYAVLRFTRNEVLRVIRGLCKVIYLWSLRWDSEALLHVYRAQFERLGLFAYSTHGSMPTWRGRDQNEIYRYHGDLSRAIVTTAYSTTADEKFLASMPVIFSDLPSDSEQVPRCFQDIYNFMQAEWGHWHLPDRQLLEDPITLPLCATYGIRHMLARSDRGAEWWLNDTKIIFRHYFLGKQSTEKLAELACKTLCHYAGVDRASRLASGLTYKSVKRLYEKQGNRHTYDTLAHAKAFYEVEMAAWDPSEGFPRYRDTTQVVYVLLHIVRATISGQPQLTASQTDALLAWGQQEIPRLREWLRGLEWIGLHKGCLVKSGNAAESVAFPHIASHYLVKMIINPLITLCSMPGGRALVSGELVAAIEHTWSAARLAYPDAVDVNIGFVWASGLDKIDARLVELRAVCQLPPQ